MATTDRHSSQNSAGDPAHLSLISNLKASVPPGLGRRPHCRESGAPPASTPFAGFLSVGHFAAHERKFSRHFKGIFLEAYREFESPLVRQQVSNITVENLVSSIVASLPPVSARNCACWPLRERIPRALHVERRSFLRTRLCQWLSLRVMVLKTATAVLLFKQIAVQHRLNMS